MRLVNAIFLLLCFAAYPGIVRYSTMAYLD